MRTHYVKNFPIDKYNAIMAQYEKLAISSTPLWRGTVDIGPQQIYIQCHIPELAKQIPDWFISTYENATPDEATPQLYLFDGVESDLLNRPADCEICHIFCGDAITNTPDIIAAHNFTFIRDARRVFFRGLKYSIDSDVRLVMGENHILMRQIKCLLENTDTQMFHGAVIGCGDFGVMLSGLSGAGKSTLAAQCLKRGLDYVGDDRIAITKISNEIIANPVYTTISFTNDMPDFPAHYIAKNYTKEKNIYRFNNDFRFRHNLPIRTIISPVKTINSAPRIVPGDKQAIISHIVTDYSNISNMVHSPTPLLDAIKIRELFESCEFLNLELGPNISENCDILCNFITKRMKNAIHQE